MIFLKLIENAEETLLPKSRTNRKCDSFARSLKKTFFPHIPKCISIYFTLLMKLQLFVTAKKNPTATTITYKTIYLHRKSHVCCVVVTLLLPVLSNILIVQ